MNLAPFGVEIVRREPGLVSSRAASAIPVEQGIPGRVAVAALHDHVLAEHAFEIEAVRSAAWRDEALLSLHFHSMRRKPRSSMACFSSR